MEEIIKEEPITLSELKVELETIKKHEKELNFRSNKTLEFLNKFVSLDREKVEELKKKIAAIKIPRLKDQHIVKIVDLMPKTVSDLKVLLQGYSMSITNENLKKIIDTLQPYLPK